MPLRASLPLPLTRSSSLQAPCCKPGLGESPRKWQRLWLFRLLRLLQILRTTGLISLTSLQGKIELIPRRTPRQRPHLELACRAWIPKCH
jgi:hypothetical protein